MTKKDFNSERCDRLGALLKALSVGALGKGPLVRLLGYKNLRTFERDLSILRRTFKADIRYDRSLKKYILLTRGNYSLDKTRQPT